MAYTIHALFRNRTEIRYQVPDSGIVNLDVYDIFGRQVAALVHEKKTAGSYTAQFDGSGLASGTYLCRLTANNSIHTQRMLLLR